MNPGRPSEVRATLAELNIRPNSGLGQNFLTDNNIRDLILREAAAEAGHRVVEVGPGLGMLTQSLVQTGADVLAIEKDAALAAYLQRTLGGNPALELIQADALGLDFDGIFGGRGATHFVSNLPYSVGTRILVNAVRASSPPARVVITVQKEVAQRIVAAPGAPAYGLLSVWVQRLYRAHLVHVVSAQCFWPRPDVASAVVRMDLLGAKALDPVHEKSFYALTKQVFSQRRKKISTCLRRFYGEQFRDAAACEALLAGAGIAPDARPETVPVESWVRLAEGLPVPEAGRQ